MILELADIQIRPGENAAFEEWRAIVGPFFAGRPSMEHFDLKFASN